MRVHQILQLLCGKEIIKRVKRHLSNGRNLVQTINTKGFCADYINNTFNLITTKNNSIKISKIFEQKFFQIYTNDQKVQEMLNITSPQGNANQSYRGILSHVQDLLSWFFNQREKTFIVAFLVSALGLSRLVSSPEPILW